MKFYLYEIFYKEKVFKSLELRTTDGDYRSGGSSKMLDGTLNQQIEARS